MAAKKKAKKIIATLYSQAGTGYQYQVQRKRAAEKMTLRKYDPIVRQHVLFSEDKPDLRLKAADVESIVSLSQRQAWRARYVDHINSMCSENGLDLESTLSRHVYSKEGEANKLTPEAMGKEQVNHGLSALVAHVMRLARESRLKNSLNTSETTAEPVRSQML